MLIIIVYLSIMKWGPPSLRRGAGVSFQAQRYQAEPQSQYIFLKKSRNRWVRGHCLVRDWTHRPQGPPWMGGSAQAAQGSLPSAIPDSFTETHWEGQQLLTTSPEPGNSSRSDSTSQSCPLVHFKNQTSSSWSFLGSCQGQLLPDDTKGRKHFICWVWLWLNETEELRGQLLPRDHSLGATTKNLRQRITGRKHQRKGGPWKSQSYASSLHTWRNPGTETGVPICSRSHSSLGKTLT